MAPELLIALGIVFGGGIVTGIAGFGFALVIVPPLLLLYSAPTVTAVAISLTLVTGWVVLLDTWRMIERSTVKMLLPGAIVGLGAGAVLIETVSEAWIKLLAGVVVLSFTVATFRGWVLPGAQSAAAPSVAGFFSGMLNVATGMAGPPVALLFAARKYSPNQFRSSIVAYFYVVDLLAMAVLIQQGHVGWSEMRVVATLLPAAMAGTVVGRRVVRRATDAQFWQAVVAILMCAGLVGVVSAIRDLW